MLNNAQTLLISFFGQKIRDETHGYKAPHAQTGTMPKTRYPRASWDKLRKQYGPKFKLFKGHRP